MCHHLVVQTILGMVDQGIYHYSRKSYDKQPGITMHVFLPSEKLGAQQVESYNKPQSGGQKFKGYQRIGTGKADNK